MGLVIDDTLISNQEHNLRTAMSTDPKMRKVIQQHIREALFEARRQIMSDFPTQNGDPGHSAMAIRTSVYDKILGDKIHPTPKPVELYAYLLKKYAKEGDRIFDPMMGSQSSRIAAYKMGFDYVGCELDKEYFEKGCELFEREALSITRQSDGKRIIQQSLF